MAKTILIVDDDPVVVKYLTTLFRDNGYDTVTAGTGLEGEEVVKGMTPDLITIAKGLTSAYAPLSGSILSERVCEILDKGSEDIGPIHSLLKTIVVLSRSSTLNTCVS